VEPLLKKEEKVKKEELHVKDATGLRFTIYSAAELYQSMCFCCCEGNDYESKAKF
jgi:hypothetical protein